MRTRREQEDIFGRRATPTAAPWAPLTLRRGLEYSRNLVTAHLLDGGIESRSCQEPRRRLRDCDRDENLRPLPSLLSVRAGRATGANDQSCRLLCCDRPGGRSAAASWHRLDRGKRAHDLPISEESGSRHGRRRRSRVVLSTQDHPAGRRRTRHRACDRVRFRPMWPAKRAQPKTRSMAGSSDSPTMSPWRSGLAMTTPIASAVRSARARPEQCRAADFRTDHRGGLGAQDCPQGAAQRPIARGTEQLVDAAIDYQQR